MLQKNLQIITKYLYPALILIMSLALLYPRLAKLGYSEYIPDETTVMGPIKDGDLSMDFLLMQRKGPMQFLTAGLVSLTGVSVYNELFYRIPFFVASILGLYFFFKFLNNMEGRFVAVTATLFLGLNGMLIAFGRIVQYQSLNFLFSFAGLYFLSLLGSDQHRVRNSILGSLFLCLSVLSHWDMVFVLPVAIFLIFKHIFLSGLRKKQKNALVGALFLPFVVVFLPFFINYCGVGLSDAGNIDYFNSRLGLTEFSMEALVHKIEGYIERAELYNPFVYLYAIGILSFVGLVGSKRSYPYFYWFLYTFLIFMIFISKPGTHIYNLFYPLSVLAALGSNYIFQLFKGFFSKAVLVLLFFLFGFFLYQAQVLFVDTTKEYPWVQEEIFGYKTNSYNAKSLPNNIIGFPIYRGWEKAAEFLNAENVRNGSDIPYITNEVTSISGFYLDLKKGTGSEYYAIGVKRPLSFTTDYTFPTVKNKKTIEKIEVNGENVMRIYKVTVND